MMDQLVSFVLVYIAVISLAPFFFLAKFPHNYFFFIDLGFVRPVKRTFRFLKLLINTRLEQWTRCDQLNPRNSFTKPNRPTRVAQPYAHDSPTS